MIASLRLRSCFLLAPMSPRRLKKHPGEPEVEGSPAKPPPMRSSGSTSGRCRSGVLGLSPLAGVAGEEESCSAGRPAAAKAACSISCWMPTSCVRGRDEAARQDRRRWEVRDGGGGAARGR